MNKKYLAIDIGTSSIKAAIIDDKLNIISLNKINTGFVIPSSDFVELDFENVLSKMVKCISAFGEEINGIEGIGLSVLCPGLVPLDKSGNPLRKAIIHLDRRSRKQSLLAIKTIGENNFLSLTGNLPFPGGISLTSILWIKENENYIYKKTYKFGHTNTFLIKKITNNFGIDPTNASFTGLYKTCDFSGWSTEIIEKLKIKADLLPIIKPSHCIAGYVNKKISKITGIKSGVPIIMGAADTACAAFGAGAINNGDILNTTGTVEAVTLVVDKPLIDKKLLFRTHVLEGKWLSMYIIGAGGASIEWARKQFFREMEISYFYDSYLVKLLSNFDLKTNILFQPYLCGDRLSISQKKGSFSKLSLNSTRDDMLLAIIMGLIKPIAKAIKKFKKFVDISDIIYCTGQGNSFLSAIKKKVFLGYSLKEIDLNSALIGAAKLVMKGLEDTNIT